MIRCILTDIEGTTSSIEFVHKVLFPYAREHFRSFLEMSRDSEVTSVVEKLWKGELAGKAAPDIEAVTALLQSWIDKDLKKPELKSLQGKIWREGYERKAYFGHVYPEVKASLESWNKKNLICAVYSSGSVEAQKLLFGHSEAGDLTSFFKSYFDTAVGAKREAQSYEKIASLLDLKPDNILFLSDIKEELDAARSAGMETCQLMRDPLPVAGDHTKAKDFEEVSKLFAL